MNWKIKASLQKILAITTIGDKLNHLPVTFNKQYHQNVFLYQSFECLRKHNYLKNKLNKNAIALEIGTGYSIIACVVLSLLGFEKIITVDITNDIRFSTFKKQIIFIETVSFLKEILLKSILTESEINRKMNLLKTANSLQEVLGFLNIIYVTNYSFEDIDKLGFKFDYISSQVVLEHVKPETLEVLFQKTKVWLQKDGFCVHTINFIDHFANPGFFGDKSISEFNFLKFSNKKWQFWSGNPIAYTNRLSYIYYLELSKKYGLNVIDFIGENYRDRKELDVTQIHQDVIAIYPNLQDRNELVKYQRGTLIVKN